MGATFAQVRVQSAAKAFTRRIRPAGSAELTLYRSKDYQKAAAVSKLHRCTRYLQHPILESWLAVGLELVSRPSARQGMNYQETFWMACDSTEQLRAEYGPFHTRAEAETEARRLGFGYLLRYEHLLGENEEIQEVRC